ncbi:MAG: cytochrome c maturation protein CcmE [Deltaproteobacteria bacterium]|nr:cytochrome c maturation protein CcmE [Deltaproteobacteria bacterium]MBI3388247.1 cytochrome c maturation protein CcmE [Deltaproteobacteria bacterium]
MTRKKRFLIGAALLVGSVAYLVYAGVRESSVYYLTIEEFLVKKESLTGEGVRVAGRVRAGSIDKKTTTAGTDLRFVLGDFQKEGGVPVQYTGILPDMFGEGRDVIVEGKYTRDGVLRAQTVMTSCPSKYEAEAGKPPAERSAG